MSLSLAIKNLNGPGAASYKQQASLTVDPGHCRMKDERNKHENRKTKKEDGNVARPAGYIAIRLFSIHGQGSRDRESIHWRKN